MRKFLIGLLAPLLATLALTTTTLLPQAANAALRWQNYDADPAFPDREAAMAAREHVFRDKFGWSDDVVKAAMEATSHAGTVITQGLKPGQHLGWMMSGGDKVYHDVVVANSPSFGDGVDVEEWTFKVGDDTYTVYLPLKCHNLAALLTGGTTAADFSPVQPYPCDIINFTIRHDANHDDREVHVGFLGGATTVMTDKHGCLGIRAPGQHDYQSLTSDCPEVCDYASALATLEKRLLRAVIIKTPTAGLWTLRVPVAFQNVGSPIVTLFCKEGVVQSCGVGVVSDNYHHQVANIWYSEADIPSTMPWAHLTWVDPIAGPNGVVVCEPPSPRRTSQEHGSSGSSKPYLAQN